MLTLLTDFGYGRYVGQMKGVIHKIAGEETIVDIAHDVTPGNVKEGAFLLWSSVPYFPEAVHVGVVDPGVGTERAEIVVTTERGTLVGPDNGLLIPAARRLGLLEVVEVTNDELFLPEISTTFHGRDKFAPVGAHVAKGAQPDEVGVVADGFIEEALQAPVLDDEIPGQVLHVDRFGNCVTSVWRDDLDDAYGADATVPVEVAGKSLELPRVTNFEQVQDEAGLLVGSTGFVEIVVGGDSAAEYLGVDVGDEVEVGLE